MKEFLERAQAIGQTIISDRRFLHRIPEVGMYTPGTAQYVQKRLTEMGISWRKCGTITPEEQNVMRIYGCPAPESTGVVAVIGQGSPCILLRADMDALPIQETTGLGFSAEGKASHMCGHDAHAAMLLGAARLLKDTEHELCGTVKLMFQPGEEYAFGSRTMINDGLLESPKVDAAMALHVGPQLESGTMTYCQSVASGAMATFQITIHGKGGHSSEPHKTIDPLNVAQQICGALNMLIPREVDPEAFATMTVGAFNSGTASNIVPDSAEVKVSFRTLSTEAYDHLVKRIPEIFEHYTAAWHTTYSTIVLQTPSTVCSPDFSREIVPFAEEILGSGSLKLVPPAKSAEDFGYVTQQVPSFFGFLGAGAPGNYPLHNPNMVLDEKVFASGAAILANSAYEWLKLHRA